MTTRRALIPLVALLAGSWTLNACARAAEPRGRPPPRSASGRPELTTQLLPRRSPPASPPARSRSPKSSGTAAAIATRSTRRSRSWKAEKADVHRVRARSGDLGPGAPPARQALLHAAGAAVGRDLHTKVFDAIHQRGLTLLARATKSRRAPCSSPSCSAHGVTEKQIRCRIRFDDRWRSNVQRAEELTKNYAVANVPVMIVNGKYIDQRQRGRRRRASCSR